MGKGWLFLIFLFLGSISLEAQNTLRFQGINLEGGPSQDLYEVIQDNSGYIWVGAGTGLYRYDGYEFQSFYRSIDDSNSIIDNHINGLYLSKQGDLWVAGLKDGICRYNPEEGNFKRFYQSKDGSSLAGINFITEGKGDQFWVASGHKGSALQYNPEEDVFESCSPPHASSADLKSWIPLLLDQKGALIFLEEYEGKKASLFRHDYTTGETLCWDNLLRSAGISWINEIIEYPQGVYWFATWGSGLIKYDFNKDEVRRFLPKPNAQQTHGENVVRDIQLDSHGNIIAATHGGLIHISPSEKMQFYAKDLINPSALKSQTLYELLQDREGGIWIAGTESLEYHHPGMNSFQWITQGEEPLLSRATPEYLKEDHAGNIWVMSPQGIDCYNPHTNRVRQFKHEPNQQNSIGAGEPSWFGRDHENKIWCNIYGSGINIIDADRFEVEEVGKEITEHGFTDMYVDPMGRTWVSTFFGVYQYDSERNLFVGWEDSLLQYLDAREAILDDYGKLWVGSWNEGLVIIDPTNGSFEQYFPRDSSGENQIESTGNVVKDPNGFIWTNGNGLLAKINPQNLETRIWTELAEVPLHLASDLAVAGNKIWIASSQGLLSINYETHEASCFDQQHGIPQSDFNAIFSSSTGHVYVGSKEGILRFHPDSLRDVETLAKIVFSDASIRTGDSERRLQLNAEELNLSYKDDFLNFKFSSLSFAPAGGIQFEYMLQGKSQEWSSLGNERQISLLDPAPGKYRLLVRANDRNGNHLGAAGALSFSVAAPWWRSNMAYLCYGFLILIAALGYTRLRTQSLRKQQLTLEKTVSERTAQITEQKIEIEKQRDRSEELLLNILPHQVAQELKYHGKAQARDFEEASILFTDFQGFTQIASRLDAHELVEEIDHCYKAFDQIISKYGLEKIKTIGDAYMAAGGLPDPLKGSPSNVILAALEMQRYMNNRFEDLNRQNIAAFQMRVGIHTGPVIAGVVGVKKFQYDVWGDTVNVASGMERAGEIGKVNVSESTYKLVEHNKLFKFTSRGAISVKGKGEMEMYFVELG